MTHWKAALRSLSRRPAFTLSAVLILALGTGATTTLFSLIDTVLWKALPYPDPDRLVTVYEVNSAKNQNQSLVAPGRLEDWNRLSQSFVNVSGYYFENPTDTSQSDPERLKAYRVGPRYFDVYNVAPLAGRWFTPNEEKVGGPGAAIISYVFWTRRFNRDPAALGKRLLFAGKEYTIVGIMPRSFAIDPKLDAWLPAQTPPFLLQMREARFFNGVGRLKPGITPAQAQDELTRVQADLGRQYPKTDKDWKASVTDLKERGVGDQRASLSILFAAVLALLLIACANAGGLILGQLHRRSREMAIRSSLGASRASLAGLVLREAALLVFCAAVLGCAISLWGVNLTRAAFHSLPRIDQANLDWRALLFTIGAGMVATGVCALAPILATVRADALGGLYQVTRTQTRGRRLLQRALVSSQFAVTVVLLIGAGLLLRSYDKMSHVEPGFISGHVIAFHVGAEWGENRDAIGKLQESIVGELQRLPGVQAAGTTNFLPTTGATLRTQFILEGSSGDSDTGKVLAGTRSIAGDYLQALRIPLQEGESCPRLHTDLNHPADMLVNRRFVELYGNGAPIVGRHLDAAEYPGHAGRVLGVVADAKEDGLDAPAYPYVYICISAGGWPDPNYVVRTSGDPRQALGAIRQLVKNVAPTRAVFGVQTLDEVLDLSLDKPRLSAEVIALFAASALTLAAVGLYSLVMLAVTSQTKEIGLRVALGASPTRIISTVISDAARPVAAGVLLGATLSAMVLRTQQVRSELFNVTATDGVALLAAGIVLFIAAMVAALIPARRAASIDPLVALREE